MPMHVSLSLYMYWKCWSGAEAAVQSRERGQPRRATSEWEEDKGYEL